MSIKYKLMLAIDSLVLLTVVMFGAIVYTSERSMLQRQIVSERENVLQSLANVASESILSHDNEMLVSYTAGLTRIIAELDLAYVTDGKNKILAHTDRTLVPRPLPLSYTGQRIRSAEDKLTVKSSLPAEDGIEVSFTKKKVIVNGSPYTVAVGYCDLKTRNRIQASLDSVLDHILKAGLVVICAATLLALWLAGRLTRPINKLVKAFAVTGGGSLNHKLEDTGRSDELGTLNRGFNGMMDKLKELDQLKKDFVSSVTHELKSPIGAIESYLDLMSYEISRSAGDPGSWPAKLPRFLENITFIKQNTNRLLRFIADLLDAARIEKGRFEISKSRARMETVIQDAAKLFLEKARISGIELSFAAPAERLPEISMDAERISQVLINLVSNALKFTPKGGKVRITAALVPMPGAPAAPNVWNRALRVSVEDTGIGIPRADLEKVFEKFYQVPGGRNNVTGPKGTGLGLYIVKSIVEAHGGKTFAESSGAGSRFGFELPV
ncbi:MAG: HAMP domain-containing sensor histidine kinase [Elusimicrobiales bacterium]|nr:HAMP domain-containing sensor histidine kinase [Elusimicrobiales bacterium]